jgi:phospholipase C
MPQTTVPLPGIEHVVVVMLENRSFDNMLGALYPASGGYNGLTGKETNLYSDGSRAYTVTVSNTPANNGDPYTTPYPDPGESFDDMAQQISGEMGGFAQNYYDIHSSDSTAYPPDIMFYFAPEQVPMTSFIARTFAVCDEWFASAPVQTFANRMFCHCGTPSSKKDLLGHVEARVNDVDYLVRLGSPQKAVLGSVPDISIFQLLDGGEDPDPSNWKVYFHDTPLSALNDYVYQAFKDNSECIANYDDSDYTPPRGTSFYDDVANDMLPKYAFIEPRYFGDYSQSDNPPNSNHPGSSSRWGTGGEPIDVRNGEAFLFDVYMTLLEHPDIFEKTLLIVTYDEHGGVYDHVTPGASVSPFTEALNPFNYTSFGVRVPAFFANPAIPAGTVFRLPAGSTGTLDHTSIISTLCAQFGLGGPLTPRDAAAPVLAGLIPETSATGEREDLEPPDAMVDWITAIPQRAGSPAPRKTVEEHDRLLAERLAARIAPR